MELGKMFVGGAWVDPAGEDSVEVINAATERSLGRVVRCEEGDVDRAVAAANAAFDSWSASEPEERARVLRALADGLEARGQEIAEMITDEVGTPIRIAQRIQAALPLTVLRSYADLVEAGRPQERIGNTIVRREPVGVVAAIAPWNYPLHQVVAKVAPAIAAGCPIVLKPSEMAPRSAFVLAEVVEAAEVPAGVFNLVPGRGSVVGEALARHDGVAAVSFTGSVEAGAKVAALAAPAIKRLTLELGGKSANVVLDDADLATAVKVGVANCFLNGGQTCTAWTRLVVPRESHDEACELARGFAEAHAPGDPRDPGTRLGPMVGESQRQSVRDLIETGIAGGADLITGGAGAPEGMETGYFVRPTVFGAVERSATIAQEEIFGPVLSIIAHDGDDDAVAIANDSKYGLHGSVWSGDEKRALAVAARMRTGTVDVNGAAYNPLAPFGGYKKSG
ncbi:MAG: aldehyde dehydrogenase family protein, partial [Actinobacteria bacterium]|nr:aldehyde dehydrogenase family protein [Actinomycetota bacterium]